MEKLVYKLSTGEYVKETGFDDDIEETTDDIVKALDYSTWMYPGNHVPPEEGKLVVCVTADWKESHEYTDL